MITAASVLDAKLDIALVVDTAGIGELMSLESDYSSGFAAAVLKLLHDFVVHRAPKK